ncbi:MAG TPA: diguanylate cyclase, partial [Steroidobacteraceae bacterium]|nr:diguanylate cyclase [Steroidobacteraceae bacterium]
TVSIGVTTSLSAQDSASTLLHRADTALYVAKRSGRNCVRIDLTSVTPRPIAATTLDEQLAASG